MGDANHARIRDLTPHSSAHEAVVHRDQARCLDRQLKERIGVGQQRAGGLEVHRHQALGLLRVAVRELGPIARHVGLGCLASRRAPRLGHVGARALRVEEGAGARVVQHQVVQHHQAWHARQQVIEKRVRRRIAHLIDRQVVGALSVPREKRAGRLNRAAGWDAREIDVCLVAEEVDRVVAGEQGRDLDAVVRDPGRGWRQRRQKREALHLRATSAYSCGP